MGNNQGKPESFNGEGTFSWSDRSDVFQPDRPYHSDTTEHLASVRLYCSLTPAFRSLVNLNQFRLLRVVGKGAFGKVRIVERKDSGLTFALKYIRKDEGEQKPIAPMTATLRSPVQSFDRRAYET